MSHEIDVLRPSPFLGAWRTWMDATGTLLTRPPSVIDPSVTGILLNTRGQVLLDRRADNGYWALPGGAVQVGESVPQAVVREIAEETGYRIDPELLRLTGVYSDPACFACSSYPDRTRQYVNITFAYLAPLDGPPVASQESLEVLWWSLSALPRSLMPSEQLRLHDALQVLKTAQGPVVR